MALRKNIAGSNKYYYALITNIGYTKNPLNHLSCESNLQVTIIIKDNDDAEYLEQLVPMNFIIVHERSITVKKYGNEVRTDSKTNEPVLDEDGNSIIDKVELGEEEVKDKDYQDPLDLQEMRAEGADISSLGYKWLKDNVDFFIDWDNC